MQKDFRRHGVMAAFAVHVLCGHAIAGGENAIIWPTPNRAHSDGRPYEDYVQPTESGLTESGMFGCVRNSGRKFHEGLDLKPVQRDRRGEAADPITAAMPGVVRYVNEIAGNSSYGRYVVIEHPGLTPAPISLSAHLLSISPGIVPGARVAAGQSIGMMGRSAGGYSIPRDRAHLHFELGFWLTRDFQRWYENRKFTSRNEHGAFNGMNVVSFDFLDFTERSKAGEIRSLQDYLARQPTAATVVMRGAGVPDFVQRYPEFLRAPVVAGNVAGWRIDFTWYGLPKAWWPLSAGELAATRGGSGEIVFHDAALLERYPCQSLIRMRGGAVSAGARLQDALDLMFVGF